MCLRQKYVVYVTYLPTYRASTKDRLKEKKKLKSFMYLVEILNVKCEHFFKRTLIQGEIKNQKSKVFQ